MLVVLVPQADVESEVAPNAPVVLREQMQPVRPAVLVAPSVAGHGRCRVTEQEIRKGVSTELPRVGEGTSRAVRLLRSELQMKVVRAQFQPMRASIQPDVVIQLEMLVVTVNEGRRIAERAVQAACGDLRKPDVSGIGRDTLQSDLARKVDPAVLAHLTTCDAHPPDAELVHDRAPEHVRVADAQVPRLRAHVSSEAGYKRLLQAACPERLDLAGIERAEACKHLIRRCQPMVDTKTHLIDVLDLLTNGGQVLWADTGSGLRQVLQECRSQRIDAICGDAIRSEWRAGSSTRVDDRRITDLSNAREVTVPHGH